MSFTRIAVSRRGRLLLKVLKPRHSGELMLAVDTVRMNRLVLGVLLSWTEVHWLVEFVQGNTALPDRSRFQESEPQQLSLKSFSDALAQAEIGMAIRDVSGHDECQDKRPSITVLPSLPKFRYLYTCPRCGCHAPSIFRVPSNDDEKLRLCSNCKHVYEVTE